MRVLQCKSGQMGICSRSGVTSRELERLWNITLVGKVRRGVSRRNFAKSRQVILHELHRRDNVFKNLLISTSLGDIFGLRLNLMPSFDVGCGDA